MSSNRHPVQRVIDSYAGVPCQELRPLDAPHRPGEPCGEIHLFCRGHAKATADERADRRGDPCGASALKGQLVCRAHGGGAPQNRKAAEAKMLEERVMGEVGQLLEEAHLQVAALSGADQLLAAINTAGSMALSYRWLLQQLPMESQWSWEEQHGGQGNPVRWVNIATDGLVGPDAKGQMRLHAYEEGLRYWTRLHGELLVKAAALGLEERRQLFEQDQVAKIGNAITALVAGLGRDLDDPAVVPVVETALRMIADGT